MRCKIVACILLILSILGLVLTAPVPVQEVREAWADAVEGGEKMIIMSGKRAQSGPDADLYPPGSPTGSDFSDLEWYSAASPPSSPDRDKLPPLRSSLRPQTGGTDPEKNQPKKVHWGPTTEYTLPPETLSPPGREGYELTGSDFSDSEWYSITPEKSPAAAPNYASGSGSPGVSSSPSPSDGGKSPPLRSNLPPQPGGTDPEKNQPKEVHGGPTAESTLPPQTLSPPPGREGYLKKVDAQRLGGDRDLYALTDSDFPHSEWYSITPKKSPAPAPAPNYASGSRPSDSLPLSPSDGGKSPEKPPAPASPDSASGSGSRPSDSLPPSPSDGGKSPEKPPAPASLDSASGSGSRPGDSWPSPPSDGGNSPIHGSESPMWSKVWYTPGGTEVKAPAAPDSASGSGSRPGDSWPSPPSDGGNSPIHGSESPMWSKVWSTPNSWPSPPSDGGKSPVHGGESPMWSEVWSTPDGTEVDWDPVKNQPSKPTTIQWGTKTMHTYDPDPYKDVPLPEPPGRVGYLNKLAAQRLAPPEPQSESHGLASNFKSIFSKFRPRSQRTVDTGA